MAIIHVWTLWQTTKLWRITKKMCVFLYKHTTNSLKFKLLGKNYILFNVWAWREFVKTLRNRSRLRFILHRKRVLIKLRVFWVLFKNSFAAHCALPSGSDLAGETSAALSAVSIVFADIDSNFSANCLNHAKQLYKFGAQYRGLYHDAIKGAAQYYEYCTRQTTTL